VFAGYFKALEENRASFTTDGFFRTGDLARMDEFGNIRLTGRIKDVINRGGENINSADIEKLIIEHPDVEDVAVVGMPDKELGERICAYVQPTSCSELSFEGIVLFLKNRGASALQLPERIEYQKTERCSVPDQYYIERSIATGLRGRAQTDSLGESSAYGLSKARRGGKGPWMNSWRL